MRIGDDQEPPREPSNEPGRLTEKEMDVLNHIGKAYYAFAELDAYHPADHDEFVFHRPRARPNRDGTIRFACASRTRMDQGTVSTNAGGRAGG